jgi:hypothetical protein
MLLRARLATWLPHQLSAVNQNYKSKGTESLCWLRLSLLDASVVTFRMTVVSHGLNFSDEDSRRLTHRTRYSIGVDEFYEFKDVLSRI